MRVTALLFVFVFTAACTSRPSASLIPTSISVDGVNSISILTVSTRQPSSDPAVLYSGERSEQGPSFAVIDISVPPIREKGGLVWSSSKNPDPRREFTTQSVRRIKSEEGRDWFQAQEANGRLFIFVHGYNVRYADAVYRLAQVANDLGTGAAPVLFTWPSRGTVSSYLYDKESATFSRDALEELIDRASSQPEITEITILAHSMGTWLTMEALRQSAIRNGRVHPKVKDVILAAPDIDVQVFRQQMQSLTDDRPYFTIVISADDRALRLSRTLAGNVDRVGMLSFEENEELRARARNVSNLTVIDLSELDVEGRMHHSKFADSSAALELINSTLEDSVDDEQFPILDRESLKSVLITLSASMEATVTSLSE